jgi:hypothetical protein
VADRREAHLETLGELLEAKPLSRREAELADLLAQNAIDAVLDRGDLERDCLIARMED